jgi:hypothetical protein
VKILESSLHPTAYFNVYVHSFPTVFCTSSFTRSLDYILGFPNDWFFSSFMFSPPLPFTCNTFPCHWWGEVTLRLTVSQSVCLGIEYPCGTCDQILLSVRMLLSDICGLVSLGHSLWREDGSAICSVITQWSESHRTCNHTLLSHLRLPQPGGPGSRIYLPQKRCPSYTPRPLGSLYIISYDSQGCSGGILTIPTYIYI